MAAKDPVQSVRRGRPRKFSRPSSANTLTLPDDVVQDLWDIIEPIAAYLREFGVFGPEVTVPDGAPLQDRLLGLTGRQP